MKFKHILLFVPFIICFACSSESSTSEEEGGEQTTGPVLLKKIVYNIDTVDEYTETFNYNGNRLTSVDYGDNTKNVYTYDDDNYLVKDEFFSEGTLEASIEIDYNVDGKMASYTETFFESTGLDDRQYKQVFTYNNNGTVTNRVYENFFNTEFELRNTETITYNAQNIVEISTDSGFKTDFAYDDKNGMFKDIYAIEILNILSTNEFGAVIYGNTNNMISEIESNTSPGFYYNDTYEYTYNEDDYPKTCIYT